MFKKVKKIELRGRICAIAATERLERMDILSSQNTKSVKDFRSKSNFLQHHSNNLVLIDHITRVDPGDSKLRGSDISRLTLH